MTKTETLLDSIGKRIVELTKARLSSQGLGDSEIIKNITYDVSGSDNDFELIISTPSYSVNIDKGRRAGAKMPPAKPIEAWMKKKGIREEASFAIRKAISIRGIKARPFLDVIVNNIIEIEDILFDFEEKEIVVELGKILKKIK